jgi:hypothetical protein
VGCRLARAAPGARLRPRRDRAAAGGGAPGIRLHRTRFLSAHNTTAHRGIPVTTIARTLLDIAAKETAARLERAVAQAIRQDVYDHQAITDVLADSNGHRGGRALAAATAREPKLTRSDWEARVLALIRAAHLPEPLVNHTLDAPDHGPCEADFFWPAHSLIIETDSWQHHGSRASFEADREGRRPHRRRLPRRATHVAHARLDHPEATPRPA